MARTPPSNHDTRLTNADAVDDVDADWIYRMEVSHALPLIDLDKTPIASILAAPTHDKFLAVMRQHYARFSSLYRVSGAFLLAILMLPRSVGYWLSVPTLLMALPSLSCSILMNSSDILKILPRQYEFWFFTVMNAINWGCLASFYSDFRILSLFGGVIGTQSVILIDSNFRTVTSGIRSTSVAAPVLLLLGAATFFRIIDTDERNYRVIPIAKVKVTLLDVFVNTSITLAIFVARKGYAKRKVLITHSAILQTIRCVVFRSKLQLKKPALKRGETCTLLMESRTFVMQRPEHGESPRIVRTVSSFGPRRHTSVMEVMPFHMDEDTVAPAAPPQNAMVPGESTANEPAEVAKELAELAQANQQQVSLVSMRLRAIDIRDVVAPRFCPLHNPLSTTKSVLFHANAVVGFVATVFTLTRRPAGSQRPPTTAEYAIATTALVTTLTFFLTCVANFHRQLARSLLRSFDFLFSSVQFTIAMFLISDMVQWDFRTLGAMAWLLWFHCVLFLDALTPHVKHNLRLRKVFLLPVIVSSLVGIIFIIYGFFFSDVADYFQDRTVWETHFRGKPIALRTKSLLMNRLFTVLLWSFRLIWEVSRCPDDELIFIRGSLDYFTPMEMFPPLKTIESKVHAKPSESRTTTTKWKPRCFRRGHAVYVANGPE